ncbi:sulfotransferase family 2 domain-containing protein [Microbacterium karelineae]|uniref:sulfotransferase family 2 domain-containing protein n=1 Tax=Microbacterium karelineae TaxID=2654283 RepID=UPI0018D4C832|nr:sulfotransferase family 2 domain-containing protein [Microbacterium karelineae]
MIISPSRRFAFVHVHKTAGESVSAALAPLLSAPDLLIDGGPRNAMRRRLVPRYRVASRLDKHSSATAMRAFLGTEEWDALYSFAVVRDPIRRAVSLYRYLHMVRDLAASSLSRRAWYATPLGRSADPASWSGIRALKATTSFSEFIRHPEALVDPGFQPQVDMVDDPQDGRIVTRVIAMERLAEEFAEVQDEIGIDPRVPLPHQNASSSTPSPRRVEVTDADREFLADRFAADFTAFGYSPQRND